MPSYGTTLDFKGYLVFSDKKYCTENEDGIKRLNGL